MAPTSAVPTTFPATTDETSTPIGFIPTCLKYVGATNIQKNSSDNSCNSGGVLELDHTGSYLYSFVVEADCNSEAAYESFTVNKSTGLLNYLGETTPNVFFLGPGLTSATDNFWAYASGGNGMYSGLQHNPFAELRGSCALSSGALSAFGRGPAQLRCQRVKQHIMRMFSFGAPGLHEIWEYWS